MEWMQSAKEHLKSYGIKPSHIRIKTLETLWKEDHHCTVDDLYQVLQEQLPTLSRTSVYNTLEIFSKKGIVRPLILNEKETRFDIVSHRHGHFQCTQCHRVFDFETQPYRPEGLEGFDIIEEDIQLYGVCKDCKKSIKESKNEK